MITNLQHLGCNVVVDVRIDDFDFLKLLLDAQKSLGQEFSKKYENVTEKIVNDFFFNFLCFQNSVFQYQSKNALGLFLGKPQANLANQTEGPHQ